MEVLVLLSPPASALCREEGSVLIITKVVICTSTSEKGSRIGVLQLPPDEARGEDDGDAADFGQHAEHMSAVKQKLLMPPVLVQAVSSLGRGEPAKTHLYRA